jgi:hypothetical protein
MELFDYEIIYLENQTFTFQVIEQQQQQNTSSTWLVKTLE